MSAKIFRPTMIAASLFALALPAAAEISGTVGMGFKAESDNWDKDIRTDSSEMEYDLLKGNFQFSELEDWTFSYRIAREVIYEGDIVENHKRDGDAGHSDNTYNFGAHYSFNDSWGVLVSAEYENRGEGGTEWAILPDYSVSLNESTDAYITFGAVFDTNQNNDNSIWLIAMPGIVTQVGEDTAALDFYFEIDEELDGEQMRYEEYGIYPSYTTKLSNDVALTYSAFVGLERYAEAGQDIYDERFAGIGIDAAYKLTPALGIKGGLGYEHRWDNHNNDDKHQPEVRFSAAYSF